MSGKKRAAPNPVPADLQQDIDALQVHRERVLIRLVTAISRACITQGSKSASEFHISLSQALVLAELFGHNGCCQEDLRAFVALDKGNVTRAVQRLEELGLVQRKQDPQDRRLVRVYVTRKALALESKMSAVAADLDACLVQGFSDKERDTLVRLLLRVEDNARAMVRGDAAGTEEA